MNLLHDLIFDIFSTNRVSENLHPFYLTLKITTIQNFHSLLSTGRKRFSKKSFLRGMSNLRQPGGDDKNMGRLFAEGHIVKNGFNILTQIRFPVI